MKQTTHKMTTKKEVTNLETLKKGQSIEIIHGFRNDKIMQGEFAYIHIRDNVLAIDLDNGKQAYFPLDVKVMKISK